MTIQVNTPDGGVANFPDNTSKDDIRKAMRAKFGGGPAKEVAQQIASGDRPVKSGLSIMLENVPESAKNLVKGTYETVKGAAEQLMPIKNVDWSTGNAELNIDPRDKVHFIESTARGMWDGLKKRYGKGLGEAIETDPVGVLADVLSLAGVAHGFRGEAVEAPTRAAAKAREIAGSDMAADVANKTATGQGPTPMDQGGKVVADRVEHLANNTEGGREVLAPFLEKRQSESFGRITDTLKDLTGSTKSAREALDDIMKEQQQRATPAYKAAYESGDRVIWSPELDRLTSAPDVQKAVKIAMNRWQNSVVADGYGAAKPGVMIAGKTVDADTIVSHPNMGGKMIKITGGRVPVMPNLQFWDYTRRAIDGMIDGEIRPDGRLTTRGRDLLKFRNGINAELDNPNSSAYVPEYAQARETWSGPESYKNAMDFGQSIFSETADNFVADFNKLKGADQQAARISVVSKIMSDLERKSTDIDVDLRDLTAKLKNRDMVRKILAILPDQASRQKWVAKLNEEVRSSKLVGQGLKNSATAKRLAMAQQAKDLIGDMVLGVAKGMHGSPTAWARILGSGWSKVKARLETATNKELAKILTGQKTSTKMKTPVSGRGQFAAGLSDSLNSANSPQQ